MDLKSQIKTFFKGEVVDDEDSLNLFSKDASIFEITPKIILSPVNSQDIVNLINFINKNADLNLSVTARAAGTCMSGGPLSDSIVLDMTHHFTKVKEVGENFAITEPGVFYRDFEKHTLTKNLILPCFTASRELNTVGGMVGNNSAGEKSLAYGQTKDWVKSLKVIFSDGNEYFITPLTKNELGKKMAQNDFEGKIYSNIFNLIQDNYELIISSKPKTSKNSSGYLIWDVWDGERFDLTKLFTGSQGTLGIITEINFELIPQNTNNALLITELEDLEELDKIINLTLKYQPESFECYDDQTIKFAVRFLRELARHFKQNSKLSVYLQFIPEIVSVLMHNTPKLMLLASFVGQTQQESLRKCLDAKEGLSQLGLKTKIRLGKETEKYWIVRRESFSLLKNHAKHMQTAPFIDDFVVKPEHLPQFLPRLQKIMEPYKKMIIYTLAGHIGNGNFHIIPLMDLTDKKVKKIIPELSEKVFDLVFEFNGSMAAEHNDGLVRGPYLDKMFGEGMYQLFKEIKYIFDPNNIFNPHKKMDATFEYSYEHITHEQVLSHSS